jgi:hypothetical protein
MIFMQAIMELGWFAFKAKLSMVILACSNFFFFFSPFPSHLNPKLGAFLKP